MGAGDVPVHRSVLAVRCRARPEQLGSGAARRRGRRVAGASRRAVAVQLVAADRRASLAGRRGDPRAVRRTPQDVGRRRAVRRRRRDAADAAAVRLRDERRRPAPRRCQRLLTRPVLMHPPAAGSSPRDSGRRVGENLRPPQVGLRLCKVTFSLRIYQSVYLATNNRGLLQVAANNSHGATPGKKNTRRTDTKTVINLVSNRSTNSTCCHQF